MCKQEGSLSIEYYSISPLHCSWGMRTGAFFRECRPKGPVAQLSLPSEP